MIKIISHYKTTLTTMYFIFPNFS